MLLEDNGYDYTDANVGTINNAYTIDSKPGWDIDLVGGYDFGMIRAEAELGYKRASVDEVEVNNLITNNVFGPGSHFPADGKTTAWSVMVS